MEGANAPQQAEQASFKPGLAAREKYWEEADAADKIERLRDELARSCKLITELSALVVKMASHSHGQDGKLMIALDADTNGNRAHGLYAHGNGIPHRLRREYERR